MKPAVVVCLGATAAQSVLGPQFKLMRHRGELVPSQVAEAQHVVATIHPSAVLRAPDAEGRRAAFEMLVADLRVVAQAVRTADRPRKAGSIGSRRDPTVDAALAGAR